MHKVMDALIQTDKKILKLKKKPKQTKHRPQCLLDSRFRLTPPKLPVPNRACSNEAPFKQSYAS